MKNLSHGFLISIHNRTMDLGNPFEAIHYLLIGGMISLSHQEGFPMMSSLVCVVTY